MTLTKPSPALLGTVLILLGTTVLIYMGLRIYFTFIYLGVFEETLVIAALSGAGIVWGYWMICESRARPRPEQLQNAAAANSN